MRDEVNEEKVVDESQPESDREGSEDKDTDPERFRKTKHQKRNEKKKNKSQAKKKLAYENTLIETAIKQVRQETAAAAAAASAATLSAEGESNIEAAPQSSDSPSHHTDDASQSEMSVAPTVDPSTELSQTAHDSQQPVPPAPSEPSLQDVVSGKPQLDALDSFPTVPQGASTPARFKSNNPVMFDYFNSEKGVDQDGNPSIQAAQSNYEFE